VTDQPAAAPGLAAATESSAPGTSGRDDASIEALGFDAALAEFQRVVATLEAGGQPLEEALELYERGVALQAHLDRLLGDAELRIRRLVERAGGRVDTVEHRDDADDRAG
jgi:exodeoxyribonuclease VII small subunit